jgi:SPX domain protein involved in polyphosphate accumulation
MRFERKYRIPALSAAHVEAIIKMHPAGFKKAYPDRWVNNVYFDTIGKTAFQDNTAGIGQRQKFRIRWYGRPMADIRRPVLETKMKDNEAGYKISFGLDAVYCPDTIYALYDTARLHWQKQGALQPSLVNSYLRSYWETPGKKFRITIDHKMYFGPVLMDRPVRGHLPYCDEAVVLEVKYPVSIEKESDFIFQYLPFRQTKNSKYVSGLRLLYA